jgi:hypothetical protein
MWMKQIVKSWLPDTEQIDAARRVHQDQLFTKKLPKRIGPPLGWSMTKAEEVITVPCRIIHAQETQYFTESITGVAVSCIKWLQYN